MTPEPTYAVPVSRFPGYSVPPPTPEQIAMSMTNRFHQNRWSDTRQQIHDMTRGSVLLFPAEQYFNCHASTQRLNDAYSGVRKWTLSRKDGVNTVRRVK